MDELKHGLRLAFWVLIVSWWRPNNHRIHSSRSDCLRPLRHRRRDCSTDVNNGRLSRVGWYCEWRNWAPGERVSRAYRRPGFPRNPRSIAGYTHLCIHPLLTPNLSAMSVTVSPLPFHALRTATQIALKSTFRPGRPPRRLYCRMPGFLTKTNSGSLVFSLRTHLHPLIIGVQRRVGFS